MGMTPDILEALIDLIILLGCLSMFLIRVHAIHPRRVGPTEIHMESHVTPLIGTRGGVFLLRVHATPPVDQIPNVFPHLVHVMGLAGMTDVVIIAILVFPVRGTGILDRTSDVLPKVIILVVEVTVQLPQHPLTDRLLGLQEGMVGIQLIRGDF
jgi:hypothetical protein